MEKTDNGYQLNRALWRDDDRAEFVTYVNSLGGGGEKAAFEQKIMNTKYPCIGVPSPDVEKIVREIAKGNYTSFIDLWITDNYTCLVIVGKLIARIKDFSTLKRYLDEYIKLVDCWGGCDCLKFNITKGNGDEFFALARELTKSENPFGRRIGLVIMLKTVNEKYIDGVLETCRSLSAETAERIASGLAFSADIFESALSRKVQRSCIASLTVSPSSPSPALLHSPG